MDLDIVIVTYNRLEKLKKALLCYERQTASFRNLIVVDNCSTDGTKRYLDEWKQQKAPFQKVVIYSEENLGGSGGFYLGQKKAMELGADWVFLADDDAYATPTMIADFIQFIENHDTSGIAAVCATVKKMDGGIACVHRDRFKIAKGENWLCKKFERYSTTDADYQKEYFDIDLLTYVGSFISGKALRKVGLVNHRYFIYEDDTEHSIRLRKYGKIIVVPKMQIVHEEHSSDGNSNGVNWRSYYDCRNKTHMLLKHYPRTVIYTIYIELRHLLGRKILNRPTNAYALLKYEAVMDALFGRLGKHSIYRP